MSSTARPLTQRQRTVLEIVRESVTDRGYPPTLREIGARMGIRSTNGVNDHLIALERKGYLQRSDMRARGIRLVDPIIPMTPSTSPEVEAVHLCCGACGEDQTRMLLSDAPLRAQMAALACVGCGVVGDMDRAP